MGIYSKITSHQAFLYVLNEPPCSKMTSAEFVLCARYSVRCFIHIMSFNPYKSPVRKLMLLYPFSKYGN